MINPIKTPIEFGRLRTFGQPMSPGVVALMNANFKKASDVFQKINTNDCDMSGTFTKHQGRWDINASANFKHFGSGAAG